MTSMAATYTSDTCPILPYTGRGCAGQGQGPREGTTRAVAKGLECDVEPTYDN